jgi:hypothetical protein
MEAHMNVGDLHVQVEIDLPAGARLKPLGLAARRTQRQRFLLSLGYHPLSPKVKGRILRLHPGAPPEGDRRASGPRCGTCRWRGELYQEMPNGSQRCWINDGQRVTRGAATEIRAWWPACEDHAARD